MPTATTAAAAMSDTESLERFISIKLDQRRDVHEARAVGCRDQLHPHAAVPGPLHAVNAVSRVVTAREGVSVMEPGRTVGMRQKSTAGSSSTLQIPGLL